MQLRDWYIIDSLLKEGEHCAFASFSLVDELGISEALDEYFELTTPIVLPEAAVPAKAFELFADGGGQLRFCEVGKKGRHNSTYIRY